MKDRIFRLCDTVRETAYALHRYLGPGHLEKVYQNGLVHRLRKAGLMVEPQVQLLVHDEDGTLLGEFFADILVEEILILELKAVREMANAFTAQLLGYLRASRIEHGLLINFGAGTFFIKKFVKSDALAEVSHRRRFPDPRE